MTWFLTREEAEDLLAKIVNRIPGYTYAVEPNGCGPEGWGIMILDADGMLVTESYSPGDIIPLSQPRQATISEDEYRELLGKAEALGGRLYPSEEPPQ